MSNIDVTYLAGGPIEDVKPLPPYDERVCDFLAKLSGKLRKDKRAAAYPDIQSFAFYCRKANIDRLRAEFQDGKKRLGKGLAFHIAPSNVPVNCAFTYLFGLLAGNANVVRVSSKQSEQVRIICDVINDMFLSGEHQVVRNMTAFVLYEKDKRINDALSERANIRVIWGGDAAISEIRKSPISARCTELTFADRYSFGILDPVRIAEESEKNVKHLAEQFYNDTYLMDQNACSTPHLLFWKSNGGEKAAEGKKRFWQMLHQVAKKYELADIKVSDKYVLLCEQILELAKIGQIEKKDNLLYIITMKELPEDITALRGKFGLFFQYDIKDLEEIPKHITEKIQTCVYYGIEAEVIRSMVLKKGLMGIDRIVPVGSSLDIGVFWDGYDIIRQMSRLIE